MLEQKRVKELFNYDETTGNLARRCMVRGGRYRDFAGCKGNHGYLMTQVDGKLYLNHRLVWLWWYGYIPENNIDHINRDRLDNRIENLREVSSSCNLRNSKMRTDNTSGIRGVCFDPRRNLWYARVTCPVGRNYFLGYVDSFEEAVALRLAGEQWLEWSGCDSSSPSYLYIKSLIKENSSVTKET